LDSGRSNHAQRGVADGCRRLRPVLSFLGRYRQCHGVRPLDVRRAPGVQAVRSGETMSDAFKFEDFRRSVRSIADARAVRDRETGISPPDNVLPRQRHWQELHRLSRKFDTETRQLIDQVVASANIELGPHGFRVQPTRVMRRLPGEANGAAWLIASESGIEPNGTLTFKLRDSGRLLIEAE